jgi:hypothetical protein
LVFLVSSLLVDSSWIIFFIYILAQQPNASQGRLIR